MYLPIIKRLLIPNIVVFIDGNIVNSKTMRPHKIVLIEDNLILVFKLKQLLEKEGYDVVETYSNGEDFLIEMSTLEFDLAIIDVKLNGVLSGIDIAKKISVKQPDKPLIFLTGLSDSDTLSQIREVNPYCYIKKPYDNNTFLVNVKLALNKSSFVEPNLKENKAFLIIEDSGKLFKIFTESILYIQSDGNYINIYLKDLKPIMLRKKLGYIEGLLSKNSFVRTHNRYIVNLNYAYSISKKEVHIDTCKIPISDTYQKQIKDQFLKSIF